MIPPSWPVAVWGLDILGPFPKAVGGYRYLYVVIDKFTKWLEATPMVNITKASATAFLKSIVCRFGVPNQIITDNGTQFKSQYFQEYCEDLGIQLYFASVAHPRSNGGLTSFQACCGGTRPHPAERPGRPLSSWSTGPKHAFPRRSQWAHCESKLSMKTCRSSSVTKILTSSTSGDGEQQSEMHGTTKRSGVIINDSCIAGNSGSGT
jgi:transposase InsO family protein